MTDAQPSGTGRGGRASRREFLLGGALGSAALLSGLLSHRSQARQPQLSGALKDIVPERLGGWTLASGDALIPVGEAPEEQGYDDLLTRYYAGEAGATVMFVMAYGSAQTGVAQLHRPEACYPAAGFELNNRQEMTLRSPGGTIIPSRTLTATAPGRTEQILYWSRIGAEFPTSSARQRWVALRQSLSGSTPDGVLVRMSVIDSNQPAALAVLGQFANALLSTPDRKLHRLLTGQA